MMWELLQAFAISGAPQAGPSRAALDIEGEVSLVTRYVDEDLSVYTRGPAIQPEITVSHEESGCYGNVWASGGLFASDGDEIEVMIGCERPIAEETNLDVAVAQYVFRGSSWSVATAAVSHRDFSLRGYYYAPNGGGPDGYRIVGGYSHTWRPLSVSGSITYDSGSHNELPSITVAMVRGSYDVSDRFRISAVLQAPLDTREGDTRSAQAWVALTAPF